MLVIQDTLVSLDIVEENFVCDLQVCKGACCTEGDYGAPLKSVEMGIITEYMGHIKPNLPDISQNLLETDTGFTFYQEPGVWGTTCHEDGSCVFLTKNALGISVCGIEKTYLEGKIPIRKPISCHLYPIRVTKNDVTGFEAWNYDRWDICQAACIKGDREKVPLYQFVKEAIIREKGEDFFNELHAAAQYLNESTQED